MNKDEIEACVNAMELLATYRILDGGLKIVRRTAAYKQAVKDCITAFRQCVSGEVRRIGFVECGLSLPCPYPDKDYLALKDLMVAEKTLKQEKE